MFSAVSSWYIFLWATSYPSGRIYVNEGVSVITNSLRGHRALRCVLLIAATPCRRPTFDKVCYRAQPLHVHSVWFHTACSETWPNNDFNASRPALYFLLYLSVLFSIFFSSPRHVRSRKLHTRPLALPHLSVRCPSLVIQHENRWADFRGIWC
jgi:hypothetical protein